jgi:hypothetical protein
MKVKTLRPRAEQRYMFEIVAPNNNLYNRLKEIFEQYPELTYSPRRTWDSLSAETIEKHKDILEEIHEILRVSLYDFVQFQNFHKSKPESKPELRLQYRWDDRFTGVGYFDLDFWNEEYHYEAALETGIII